MPKTLLINTTDERLQLEGLCEKTDELGHTGLASTDCLAILKPCKSRQSLKGWGKGSDKARELHFEPQSWRTRKGLSCQAGLVHLPSPPPSLFSSLQDTDLHLGRGQLVISSSHDISTMHMAHWSLRAFFRLYIYGDLLRASDGWRGGGDSILST